MATTFIYFIDTKMHVFPHLNIAKIMMRLVSYNPCGSGESWDLAALPVPVKIWSPTLYIMVVKQGAAKRRAPRRDL